MGLKLEWTFNQSGNVKALERFLEIFWHLKLEWLNQRYYDRLWFQINFCLNFVTPI